MTKNTVSKHETELLKPTDILEASPEDYILRIYKERWWMLTIYLLCVMCCGMQYFELLIVGHVLVNYFPVSLTLIHATGFISIVAYLVWIVPCGFIQERLNIRQCAIIAMVVTVLGAWLKVMCVKQEWFNYMLVAQFISLSGQSIILSLPIKVASVWFPNNEVSTACCIGQSGVPIGIALGFFIPPLIVIPSEDPVDIGNSLRFMLITMAIISTFVMLITFICFKAAPPHPPSIGQAKLGSKTTSEGLLSVAKSLINKPVLLLFILTAALMSGTMIGFNNFLGPLFVGYFPEKSNNAGIIGSIAVLSGLPGTVLSGVILDKTKKYKQTLIGFIFCTGMAMTTLGVSFETRSIVGTYISVGAVGFLSSAALAVTYEVLAEITYPISSVVLSLYQATSNFTFALIVVSILNVMFYTFATIWTQILLTAILFSSALFLLPISMKQERQKAQDYIKTNIFSS